MTTEAKQNPPSPATQKSRPEAIPVRFLKFRATDAIDLPGKNAASSVTGALSPSPSAYYAIEYQPWLRHHRITYFEPGEDGKRRTQVAMVHESRVASWEPA